MLSMFLFCLASKTLAANLAHFGEKFGTSELESWEHWLNNLHRCRKE